jgi:hypothetical protein
MLNTIFLMKFTIATHVSKLRTECAGTIHSKEMYIPEEVQMIGTKNKSGACSHPYLTTVFIGPGMVVNNDNPSYWGGRGRRIHLGKSMRPSLPEKQTEKKKKSKRAGSGSVAQVIDFLLSKCKALSLIPSTSKI